MDYRRSVLHPYRRRPQLPSSPFPVLPLCFEGLEPFPLSLLSFACLGLRGPSFPWFTGTSGPRLRSLAYVFVRTKKSLSVGRDSVLLIPRDRETRKRNKQTNENRNRHRPHQHACRTTQGGALARSRMGASPRHLVFRHLFAEGRQVKRIIEAIAFLAICALLTVTALGFCGFFD